MAQKPGSRSEERLVSSITINVPVVFMGRDVMILMQANPFQGPLEGVGPENRDFFGPLNGYERS
jgi:hypothetical protein